MKFNFTGKGVKDLFIMPVEEYRKEDGRIVRGLHEGAESFGFSTTTAVVDVARKVFGGIQVIKLILQIIQSSCKFNNKLC